MIERRLMEIELLEKRYGAVKHDDGMAWILFERFQFPPGWNRTEGPLLVPTPPGYPMTPPDNFYVAMGLRTASGAMPSNFEEGQPCNGQQWGRFSFHVESPAELWKPSADILNGHNLLTFMLGVEKRLREAN